MLDAERLPGHPAGVLQPGITDVPRCASQGPREALHGLHRGHVGFFNDTEQMRARAAGRVAGNLLDEEVLGMGLDDAPATGQVGGEIGQGVGHE
jgi:hypothetical protein